MNPIEEESEKLLPEIRNWLNLNINPDSIGLFYALMEAFQERLDAMDLPEGKKGAILTDLFVGMQENNKEEIALYREIRRAFHDGQHSTKH